MALPSSIEFKAQTCLVQELRRHGEVHLGRRQICVPHVHGQLRQQQLHIFAFAIPRRQSMNCRSMAQIMEARLAARPSISTQTGVLIVELSESADRGSLVCGNQIMWRSNTETGQISLAA